MTDPVPTMTGWRFQDRMNSPVEAHMQEAIHARIGRRQPRKALFTVDTLAKRISEPVCLWGKPHEPPAPRCNCGLFLWTHRTPANRAYMQAMCWMPGALLLKVRAENCLPSTDPMCDERATAWRASTLCIEKVYFNGKPPWGLPPWSAWIDHEVVPDLWQAAQNLIPTNAPTKEEA